jgi:ketosteroid isomerase-like protein
MKKQISVLMFLAFAFLFSCENSKKVDLVQEMKTLRQTTDSLVTALISKDISHFMNFYDIHALYISPDNAINNGIDEIKETYSAAFSLAEIIFNAKIQDIQVAKAADLGYSLVPWNSKWKSESGDQIENHGTNLLIWKKQVNGSWKVIIDKP